MLALKRLPEFAVVTLKTVIHSCPQAFSHGISQNSWSFLVLKNGGKINIFALGYTA